MLSEEKIPATSNNKSHEENDCDISRHQLSINTLTFNHSNELNRNEFVENFLSVIIVFELKNHFSYFSSSISLLATTKSLIVFVVVVVVVNFSSLSPRHPTALGKQKLYLISWGKIKFSIVILNDLITKLIHKHTIGIWF